MFLNPIAIIFLHGKNGQLPWVRWQVHSSSLPFLQGYSPSYQFMKLLLKEITMHTDLFRKLFCFSVALLIFHGPLQSVASENTNGKPARQSLVYIRYYLVDNKIPYIRIQTKIKTEKGFSVAGNIPVSVFLNGDSSDALIDRIETDSRGEGLFYLPVSSASRWNASGENTFHAKTTSSDSFDAITQSITIFPSKLETDTATTDGEKTVTARLMKKETDVWIPVDGVDIRLAVKRLGGNLNIGEDETYTTDSTGMVSGKFKLAKLPGDSKGNIEIVAMVDDHEELGTLSSGMQVPWGAATVATGSFDERTLWATGSKAPIWLLVMAFACIIGVWSVIIYLVAIIIKIRKLGNVK
jgi:hypothetical protein